MEKYFGPVCFMPPGWGGGGFFPMRMRGNNKQSFTEVEE